MELVKHETCLQYLHRRLSEGWRCISLEGYNAILISPCGGVRRELDLRNDTLTLRPNAAGDLTELTPFGETNNWECVDEAVADEDTTYNRNNATNVYQEDLYNLPDHTTEAGTINDVKVYVRAKRIGDLGAVVPRMKTLGTLYSGGAKSLTASYADYTGHWNTNPSNAHAWTWEEIDALQIGLSLKDNYDQARVTQVYVEVDYTPAYILHEWEGSDGLELTDTLVKAPMKMVSDGIALSDVLVKSPIKILEDGIAFTDALVKVYIHVRALIDGIAFTDSLVKSTAKVITDGIAFTDTLKKLWVHGVLRVLRAVRNLPSVREIGPKR